MSPFTLQELLPHEAFDPVSLCKDAPFTQASFYGEWQQSLGRKVTRMVVSQGGSPVAYLQIITYPLLFGKTCLYVPYGPVVKTFSKELLEFLKKELKEIAKKHHAVFVRLDFTPVPQNLDLSQFFTRVPLASYHAAYFQPRVEWCLDLRKPEEELLKDMHKNTRYSIHTAQKRGVSTKIITEKFETYFPAFYELVHETAMRNSFGMHPKKYYENIFKTLQPDYAYLSIATYEEKMLTINLMVRYNKTAHYVFSGSSNQERNAMPSYLALWSAIQHAKKLGDTMFNFGAVSSGNIDKNFAGLTSFKKKFGGAELRHAEPFDIIVKPFWYYVYMLRKLIKTYL